MKQKAPSLFDWNIAGPAIVDAFKKLNPRLMIKNPVMFVTMVGAALTTVGIFTAEPALRGYWRHPCAQRPHCRSGYDGEGRRFSRPHDCSRRRRASSKNAERNRPDD